MLGFERRATMRTQVPVEVDAEETSDAIVGAIDAALAFTAARELLSTAHVMSLIDMLHAVEVGERCSPTVTRGLAEITDWISGLAVVSACEVADRLLDLRLEIASVLAPTPIPTPLVAV